MVARLDSKSREVCFNGVGSIPTCRTLYFPSGIKSGVIPTYKKKEVNIDFLLLFLFNLNPCRL